MSEIITVTTQEEYINNLELYYLPIFNNANYKYRSTINQKEYILEFKWNTGYEFWTVCFYNINEELICSIKVVQSMDLLKPYNYSSELPNTFLFCIGVSGANEYPDQFSLGQEHSLFFTNIILREYE